MEVLIHRALAIVICTVSALSTGEAWAGSTPEFPDDSCSVDFPRIRTDRPSARLPDADRLEARQVERRARALADAYHQVEWTLREAGLDPDDFPEQELSWAGVIRDESILVGVYRIDEAGRLERLDAFGGDGHLELADQLAVAERALAHAPRVCGPSYGVVDAGIDAASGEYVYALRLADRRRELAMGMHYRYTLADGDLSHVERMSYSCGTMVGGVREDLMREVYLDYPDPAIRRGARGRSLPPARLRITLPGWSLPPETALYLFHLYPDLKFESIRFLLEDRGFEISRDDPRIPGWYTPITNPCVVSDGD